MRKERRHAVKIGLPAFSFNAGSEARPAPAPCAAIDKRQKRFVQASSGAILRRTRRFGAADLRTAPKKSSAEFFFSSPWRLRR
jgi:hypothetical protein